MRIGDWAWIVLVAAIVVYEIVCPPGDLLSQAMDTYRYSHPLLVNGAVLYFAGHFTRVWPAELDPLTQLAMLFGK